MARVTLQTIADHVGVSRMTVSNAFSRPDQLSDELRERILAAAAELGYVGPDPAARALARGQTGAVGILLTDSLQYAFTDEVATRFLGALVRVLEPTGLALTLLTATDREGVVPARDVAMDGAIVYSCRAESAAKDWLLRRGLPLVFVDQPSADGQPTVNVDDRAGARAAAQHLVDLGHRRVGIVTVVVDDPPGPAVAADLGAEGHPQHQRMLGWLDALEPAGIEPSVVRIRHGEDEARDAARTLLDADDRPTALLCFSDVVAVGAARAARGLGLDLPADLSIVGFDDSPVARRLDPELTTVRQDVLAKGRLAGEALIDAIAHRRAGTPAPEASVLLPTELIVRHSTAPPRS